MTPGPARRRVTVQPAAPRPTQAAVDVVHIAGLPEYLRRHNLRVVRLDWPAGSPNPTLIVEEKTRDKENGEA